MYSTCITLKVKLRLISRLNVKPNHMNFKIKYINNKLLPLNYVTNNDAVSAECGTCRRRESMIN